MTHPARYVGMDLHQKYSELCALDEQGLVVESARVATTRAALTRWFRGRSVRVCLEAGGSSPWVDRLLRELGQEVYVCNPRRVRLIAESTLKNDQIDAHTLARLVRLDPSFLCPITHRREDTQRARAGLKVRATLVKSRTACINSVRGLLRGFGYRLGKGTTEKFPQRVEQAALPEELRRLVAPLVTTIAQLSARIQDLDQQVKALAQASPVATHLQSIPGVGPVVALALVYCLEDPSRFKRSRDVAGFLGLRPCLRASADTRHQGRITKQGDPMMRTLLVQAAHALLRSKTDSELKRWAEQLAFRVGKNKAVVALARKLAVLMHRLWTTGEVYAPHYGLRGRSPAAPERAPVVGIEAATRSV